MRLRIRKTNSISLLTLLLCGLMLTASAQKNFKYHAALQKVDSTGFYRINLQPAFIAKGQANLADIRIANVKGGFVPYIQAGSLPLKDQTSFMAFDTVGARLTSDTGTTFIISNKTNLPLNRLWIRLQNTAVQRSVNITGSDDLKQWFAIQENVPLQEAVQNSAGTYMQSLLFPASNYRYLKISVDDKNKTPIRFLQAGIYREYAAKLAYVPIAGVKVSSSNSGTHSYVSVKLTDNFLVNKLRLHITSPKYFKRDVAVYEINGKRKSYLTDAELNSAKEPELQLAAKGSEISLQIDNGDNPPLTIDSVEAYQADEYLISYLERGQNYQLLTGDSTLTTADYDLKFFADSIKDNVPVIAHAAVTETPMLVAQIKTREYTLYIWIAIIASLGLLLLLSFKMIKEMNKESGKKNIE